MEFVEIIELIAIDSLNIFQIYKQAVKKLSNAYFSHLDTEDAIQRGNTDLISDLNFGYSVLKAVAAQTYLNNNSASENKKNTFLLR